MKTRIGAVLIIGMLVCINAGCGSAQYKEQKTGGEEQMKMVTPGQTLKPPSGAPGGQNVGGALQPTMGTPGQPMRPPMGAPGR
ncbi:MAG: hypothetical protein ACO1SX_23880 [Actinomycetota bacterium]